MPVLFEFFFHFTDLMTNVIEAEIAEKSTLLYLDAFFEYGYTLRILLAPGPADGALRLPFEIVDIFVTKPHNCIPYEDSLADIFFSLMIE